LNTFPPVFFLLVFFDLVLVVVWNLGCSSTAVIELNGVLLECPKIKFRVDIPILAPIKGGAFIRVN
jgi:hypothetical protein